MEFFYARHWFIIGVSFFVLASSCGPGIRITPFTEKERYELGRIGIEADSYVPKAVLKDGALSRASNQLSRVGDRIAATGKGAYEGGEKGFLLGAIPCQGDGCVLSAALSLTGMTIGTVVGAINGAVEGPGHYTEAPPENYDAHHDYSDELLGGLMRLLCQSKPCCFAQ